MHSVASVAGSVYIKTTEFRLSLKACHLFGISVSVQLSQPQQHEGTEPPFGIRLVLVVPTQGWTDRIRRTSIGFEPSAIQRR